MLLFAPGAHVGVGETGGATPTALRMAQLIAYTVPSGPMTVGVYASKIPGDRMMPGPSVLVARSQRYNMPSSLLARTAPETGSTAAVLMHHSRTALGYWLSAPGSG